MYGLSKKIKEALTRKSGIIEEVRKEDDIYYQGPFWIIADTLKDIHRGTFSIIGEKYESTYNGDYSDNSLSKSQRTHAKIWRSNYASTYNNVEYDYYPRGRVAIYKGTAFLHINSKCNIPKVIDSIIREYNIKNLELEIDLNDQYQGSHYDFKLT